MFTDDKLQIRAISLHLPDEQIQRVMEGRNLMLCLCLKTSSNKLQSVTKINHQFLHFLKNIVQLENSFE